MQNKKIGFLLFDEFTGMDLTGPLEVFASVSSVSDKFRYETQMVGIRSGVFRSDSGLKVQADVTLSEVEQLDTLVIPGGAGCRHKAVLDVVRPWLLANSKNVRRLVSVCTGAYMLADAGLLTGQKATTHWRYVEKFMKAFPAVNWSADALYIDNGNIATSAGIASGIDLSLKLVEQDLGIEVATKVARFMVVHFRRNGNQTQYSEPLQFQAKHGSRFSNLTAWILSNLTRDLTLEAMADYMGMSVRNFCRRFQQQMDTTPAKYVECLRLDHARHMLTDDDWSIARIASASGYNNIDVFRRAFERRFQMTPRAYRESFSLY